MKLLSAAVWASVAVAFSNSSPHLLLSSVARLDSALSQQQGQTASSTHDFDQLVTEAIAGCPADSYVFVSQPGMHAADLEDALVTPFLHRIAALAKSSFSNSHVFGTPGSSREAPQDALRHLEEQCGAKTVAVDGSTGNFDVYVDTQPRVLSVSLDALPAGQGARDMALKANDDVLKRVLSRLPSPNYILVFVSSPDSDGERQESMSFTSQAEGRDDGGRPEVRDNVFAKYQFFSPGIFMSIIVSLLLVAVMLFALSWISSLQISYGAFEKDPELVRQKKTN